MGMSNLKIYIEKNFGRKLRLKWFFRNDERQFNINPFKQKSKFNPGKNDAAIKF